MKESDYARMEKEAYKKENKLALLFTMNELKWSAHNTNDMCIQTPQRTFKQE